MKKQLMIQALNNRLIVQAIEKKEAPSKGVLIMPDGDTFEAVVVAKGSEVCPNVEIDDIVVLMTRSGIPFEIDGEKFLSLIQEEVLCAYNQYDDDEE